MQTATSSRVASKSRQRPPFWLSTLARGVAAPTWIARMTAPIEGFWMRPMLGHGA
jgi:hypothetical protein